MISYLYLSDESGKHMISEYLLQSEEDSYVPAGTTVQSSKKIVSFGVLLEPSGLQYSTIRGATRAGTVGDWTPALANRWCPGGARRLGIVSLALRVRTVFSIIV